MQAAWTDSGVLIAALGSAQIRVVEIETGDFLSLPREWVFEDPDFDFVGILESFIQRDRQASPLGGSAAKRQAA